MELTAALKRLNAALGVFTSAVLAFHIVLFGIDLLKESEETVTTAAYILMILTLLHGVIGIATSLLEVKYGTEESAIAYRNITAQRVTGIIVAVLVFFHIAIAKGMAEEAPSSFQSAIFYFFEFMFIATALYHCALAVPNALLRLDFFKTEKVYAIAGRLSFVLFGALAIFGIGSFGAYLLG